MFFLSEWFNSNSKNWDIKICFYNIMIIFPWWDEKHTEWLGIYETSIFHVCVLNISM